MLLAANQSLSESDAITDTLCVFFGFSIPGNRNRYIFFESCEVSIVFPFINFFCQSSKRLSADRLRCEDRCFYMVTSNYLFCGRRRTAWWIDHKANKFSRATLCASCENGVTKFCKPIFSLPQSHLQASMKHMYACDTRPFSNSMPPSQLRTKWFRTKWQMWSWLEHTVSATCSYNGHIHLKIVFQNLDQSWEKPQGPSKAGIWAKARRFPPLSIYQ